MKNVLALVLIFLCFSVVEAQTTKSTSEKSQVAVNFCDLVNSPEKYKGKEVIIQATYQYGFEVAALYCLACVEKKAWVEFDSSFKKSSKSRYTKKIKNNGVQGRTVNVVFVGTLLSEGGFGHLGIYPYKFIVKSMKSGEIIADSGLNPHALPKKEQEKLCPK